MMKISICQTVEWFRSQIDSQHIVYNVYIYIYTLSTGNQFKYFSAYIYNTQHMHLIHTYIYISCYMSWWIAACKLAVANSFDMGWCSVTWSGSNEAGFVQNEGSPKSTGWSQCSALNSQFLPWWTPFSDNIHIIGYCIQFISRKYRTISHLEVPMKTLNIPGG